ncbi:MAG: hypothetical protein COA58_14455 [Bacteroidetes bacterium]|nr:MAG: hypothetical protein COA58_14455 [Bacteroidota bacterium]
MDAAFFCFFVTMNKLAKLLLLFVFGASIFTLQSCSEETSDPEPTKTISCQLTGIGETSDGSSYNSTFTYNTDGLLTQRQDPDGATDFIYKDGKLTSLTFDESVGVITYDGNDLPYKIEFEEDGEKFYFILKSKNGRYVTLESHEVSNGNDVIVDVTNITYNSDGNVTKVINQEYDADKDVFNLSYSITNITTDNKKNPYLLSPSLLIFELLGGDEANLGINNVVTATYNYGSFVDVSNSYIYNDQDYPTKRDEIGFSSPTIFNFAYDCK